MAGPRLMSLQTLDRTTTAKGPVEDYTWEQLEKISAGYPVKFGDRYLDQKIPRLEDVFAV